MKDMRRFPTKFAMGYMFNPYDLTLLFAFMITQDVYEHLSI